jgi:hypothetical protein
MTEPPVSVAEVPTGEIVVVGKVIAPSVPALTTGGIFAQIVPFQELPAVQDVVTVAIANGLPPLL